MAEKAPTPEMLEKFKAGRQLLKTSPTLLDASIDQLSAAAQEPAKKFRDLMLSDEEDLAKFHAAAGAIRASIPEALTKELDAHKLEVAKILGLPTPPN